MPARALLNDLNPHLIHFYSWLRKGIDIEIEMANEETLFYEQRTRFNFLLAHGKADSAEAAALFYYLNRTGFNGLCRFNRSGEFNVPFGSYNRINYTRDFSIYQEPLRKWTFVHGDFEALPIEADDFIYADPPYDVEFTTYSKEGFGWPEQVRTAEWLAKHKGPVILSNQATSRINALYEKLGYKLQFLNAPRRISCTGDRTPAREVIAMRNLR
jgi:DNA adenine methylase